MKDSTKKLLIYLFKKKKLNRKSCIYREKTAVMHLREKQTVIDSLLFAESLVYIESNQLL